MKVVYLLYLGGECGDCLSPGQLEGIYETQAAAYEAAPETGPLWIEERDVAERYGLKAPSEFRSWRKHRGTSRVEEWPIS